MRDSRIVAVLLLLVLASLLPAPVLAQTTTAASSASPSTTTVATSTSNPPSNPKAEEPTKPEARAQILKEWNDLHFWIFLLVIALFGAFGGVIYELLLFKGRFELPHKTDDFVPDPSFDGAIAKHLFDLGILGRMLIGAAAAVVVVWLLKFDAQGPIAVIAGSIIAGATGIAVFRSLQDRLLAALATRDLAKAQAQAAAQTQKVEQASAELEKLKKKITPPRVAARGVEAGAAPQARDFAVEPEGLPSPTLPPELENATRLLGEARALGMAAAGAAVSVRLRVYRVLASWSGVPLEKVPPDSKKIVDLWQQNPDNPKISDGLLSDLIVRLKEEFPTAGIALVPNDLQREDGVDTIAKLVLHIELRV